jgi:single-stranded DNA-binding protein
MATAVVIGKVQGEVRTGDAGGTPVVNFRVAEKRFVGKGKGFKESGYDTAWWSAAYFGSRASAVAPFLTPGSLVAISGDVSLREYEHNGAKRAELTIKAADVTLLGEKPKDDASSSSGDLDY